MMKIIEESKKYNDLIVTSLTDTYDTLTLKVELIKSISKCFKKFYYLIFKSLQVIYKKLFSEN